MLKKVLQHCDVEDFFEKEFFPCNYFPVPQRYIVYQTGSEKKSQIYDYSPEVVALIQDILNSNKIDLIQVGDLDDKPVPSSIDLRGKLSIRQLAYVIKNCEVCITSNRLAVKLCRIFKKKAIFIGSNFPNTKVFDVFPGLVYIEPKYSTPRLSYKEEEEKKTINSIKPEVISVEILNQLGIDVQSKFKTLFIGEKYGPQIFDLIPDGPIPDVIKDKPLHIRLDILFEPKAVELLSAHTKLFISTNKPFDLCGVNSKNIKSLSYFCDKNPDIDFVKDCFMKNISLYVICENKENLNDARFKLLGLCEVYRKISQKPFDFSDSCDIFFKSSRYYVGKGKIYQSLYHYKNNLETNLEGSLISQSFINDEDFLESKESIYLFTV